MYSVVQFSENDGGSVSIVNNHWLTPRRCEVYWPPVKGTKALTPDEKWNGIQRVFYETDTTRQAQPNITQETPASISENLANLAEDGEGQVTPVTSVALLGSDVPAAASCQGLTGYQAKVLSLLSSIKTQNDQIISLLKHTGTSKGTLKPELKFPIQNADGLNTIESLLEMKENHDNLSHELPWEDSPLANTPMTSDKLAGWSAAVSRGEKTAQQVYGKPSADQLRELEHVRSLSRELQDQLHELENAVRISDVENQAMNPTAPILDYSEDHEFVSANQLDNYYAEEDRVDAKEEEKRRLTKGNAPRTEIQMFYRGQSVFLTGGSGFLGKVIIEKLLRSCGDLETIYVLIRSKKGKDARTRLHEILEDFVFNKVHEENPKGIFKVVPIIGDMELPGLGISEEDRKTLAAKVTIIINAAATVKFDEKLSVATAINVRGTREVIGIAKECKKLKALTHISTAFSNCHVKCIEEKFYETPMSPEALEAVAAIDENLLESITPKLLGKYPNTYCFTKAIAEETVRKFGEGMPISIVRPSIVVSTYEEPVRGWTDSMYGPTGLMVGIGTGVLRTMYVDVDKRADMVPVDFVVNAVLASAWHTAKNFRENQTSDIPIYNFVSGPQNPLTWGTFIELNQKHGIDKPTTKAVWYYGLTPTSSYYMFLFYNFFLHFLPALFVDAYLTLIGRNRMMLKFYNRVMRLANILFYFSTQEWQFSDHGVRGMWGALGADDRVVFPFNMAEMSWEYHAETFLVGLRVYLVKDDLSTLPEARKKWNRLYLLHQFVKFLTLGLLLNLAYIALRSVVRIVFG